MINYGLGIGANIFSIFSTLGARYGDPFPVLCTGAVGLAVSGYILHWFGTHSEYFD